MRARAAITMLTWERGTMTHKGKCGTEENGHRGKRGQWIKAKGAHWKRSKGQRDNRAQGQKGKWAYRAIECNSNGVPRQG